MCSSNSHGTGIFPRFGCEEKTVWLAERWYTRHKTSAAAAGVNPIGQLLTGKKL